MGREKPAEEKKLRKEKTARDRILKYYQAKVFLVGIRGFV